jgi:hypothetical protein
LAFHCASRRRKNSDLVAHFFRRTWNIIRDNSGFGLIATNTIAEGDTRQGGLNGSRMRGPSSMQLTRTNAGPERRPSSPAACTKGRWNGERTLLGRPASFISAFLSNREEWSLKKLKANDKNAYIGSF